MLDTCVPTSTSLLTINEALQRIALAITPVADSELISLQHALGRVLAQPVYAPIDLPYDRNSAMDGYAFASVSCAVTESTTTLTCVGTSWAGRPFRGQLQAGQCIRIFTGAVVPIQADTVIMQEQVQITENSITFSGSVKPYQNIRAVGEDVTQGDCLLVLGKKLTVSDISLLASAGVANVWVKRKLRVAFFSTGDELISLTEQLTSGKIYDSNRYTLAGLLTDNMIIATDMGIIADDLKLLENQLCAASKIYDVLITTGGASVGDADYIADILARRGHVNFWKIAIKPGKPLAFGTIGNSYFFGLPGNPVSVMATFQHIVVPALQQLAGEARAKSIKIKAICISTLKKAAGRVEYQRGMLTQDENGCFWVSSSGGQGSHMLGSLSRANCYIILPLECAGVTAGDSVWIEPFSLQLAV